MFLSITELLPEILSRKVREGIIFVLAVFLISVYYFSPQLYNKIIISTFNYVVEEKTKEIMPIINNTVNYFQEQNTRGT